MVIKSLNLQNFRSYSKASFEFSTDTTFIVGPNTSGKSNLLEAIVFLSQGKSFHTDNDTDAIALGKEIARIKGSAEETALEVVLTHGMVGGVKAAQKKYSVNGVAKRKTDFEGNLLSVIFSPLDLEIIIGSPSKRRDFLDSVLEQVYLQYRQALLLYTKALRQRNALLQRAQETGRRSEKEFEYWDDMLIRNGEIITTTREEFIEYVNSEKKDIFQFTIQYDKSIISSVRLLQYKDAEVAVGNTLVGPHRDDYLLFMSSLQSIKTFGSRGQQRLTVLQLKLFQLLFIEREKKEKPLLLMDDIFSELDNDHIQLVLEMTHFQQRIITTTHKEFIDKKGIDKASMIELE